MLTPREKDDVIKRLCARVTPRSQYAHERPPQEVLDFYHEIMVLGLLGKLDVNNTTIHIIAKESLFEFRDMGGFAGVAMGKSDKELILLFLGLLDDVPNQFHADTMFEKIGVASLTRIEHLLDMMKEKGLVKEAYDPFVVMPTMKGLRLTSDEYDKIFANSVGPVQQNSFTIHGNVGSVENANIKTDYGPKVSTGTLNEDKDRGKWKRDIIVAIIGGLSVAIIIFAVRYCTGVDLNSG